MESFQGWHFWVLGALILGVAELLAGGLALLALALACLLGALAAGLGVGLSGQLSVMGLASLLLVPACVWRIRRQMSRNKGYGTTGTGFEQGARLPVVRQAGALGVKYRGDFLPVCYAEGGLPEEGCWVDIQHIKGITAIVTLAPGVRGKAEHGREGK